jgi:serine/threonine protein kinase
LQSYGLGKLDDLLSETVGKHLAECDSCRVRVAELTSDTFLGRLQEAQARPASIPPVGSSLPGMSRLDGDSRTPPPPSASTLPPGLAEHPDYEVLRELGRGGMGVVYLARNKLMGRNEVLKVVGGHLLERPGVAERFLREIRSAAMLHHTNIVTAYSVLRVGQSLVFAMEYVEGFDLAQLVKGRGPLRVDQACNFIHQAALGLQYAKEKGMVHRDIKPSNLIVARERNKPVVKVLDFGLSKVTSEGQGQGDGGLTREGQMLGTPDYIAPEQIRDAQSADIRADIYSLGCTLYCLLAGRPPFRGDNLWDLYQAHFSMNANPLNLLRPEVPAELAALVAKMMAKDPRRRFQTPGEVAEALKPFFKPAASRPSGSSPEVSRINPPAPPIQTQAVTPAPAQPATPATAPTPPVRKPSKTGAEGVAWESLIEIKEDESQVDAVKPKPADLKPARQKPQSAAGPVRRPPWMWPAVAAAPVLGLIALGVIIITIRYKNGREMKITAPEDSKVVVRAPRKNVEVNPPANEQDEATNAEAPARVPRLPGSPSLAKLQEPPPDNVAAAFVRLFNGKDLSGWMVERGDPAIWSVEDGAIVARSHDDWLKPGILLADRDFSDFIIPFQFQLPKNADSGLVFRMVPGDYRPADVKIRSFDEAPSLMAALNWYIDSLPQDCLLPNPPAELRPEGSWNDMEAEFRGDGLRVSVNGRDVLSADLGEIASRKNSKDAIHRRFGRIGFQAGINTIRFRNIEIKELAPPDSSPDHAGGGHLKAKEKSMTRAESGLRYRDTKGGNGEKPSNGQTCVMHYTGWLWEDDKKGKKFDSSVDRGDPFEFTLGVGQVIKGWDEGVSTMRVGGKRELLIPPELAYGRRGAGGVIPPNATLLFEVELLSVK